MKRVDVMSKSIILLIMLSIVYTLIGMKLIFLAPILTVSIPYRFMKYKENNRYIQNRKILNGLFLFNLITFIGVMFITKKSSLDIFEIVINILITFIYFKVLCLMERKKVQIYENPEKLYQKINKKVDKLERVYKQTEELMEKSESENVKSSMRSKLINIKRKIDELKKQSLFIEQQINAKNNKSNNK